mmetsp:Transcript_126845/g.283543  ORF Transcript_126845/g.283543 Transcript_126845/m.283543 type:complete len:189 (+) Transcript_126845:2-568(+)
MKFLWCLACCCRLYVASAAVKAAVLGNPCNSAEYARLACRAVVVTKRKNPYDNLEHIPIETEACSNWMIANASEYQSVMVWGPSLQRCLIGAYAAHPSTRFISIDFCVPGAKAAKAGNLVCGAFKTELPNYSGGLPPEYAGVASEQKIALIQSIASKELIRLRNYPQGSRVLPFEQATQISTSARDEY